MSVEVALQDVSIAYDRTPVIQRVTGTFDKGSLTAIAGPNGAGKSTLLKAIAGILKPSAGEIRITGASRNHIAYLPQAAILPRDFPMTVGQMVAIGFWSGIGNKGAITPEMRAKVERALTAVGLSGLSTVPIERMSAGQFQRALFARIIVQDASLILLDEPFTAVDDATCHELMHIIQNWHRDGRTVICVSHDFHHIRHHFPHCMLLAHCCVAWGDSESTLHEDHLEQAHKRDAHTHGVHP
ncbi:MAG: ABC transporter ATP-binding protein [Rickettsiales bacterium]